MSQWQHTITLKCEDPGRSTRTTPMPVPSRGLVTRAYPETRVEQDDDVGDSQGWYVVPSQRGRSDCNFSPERGMEIFDPTPI
jgi:hypothetical protein